MLFRFPLGDGPVRDYRQFVSGQMLSAADVVRGLCTRHLIDGVEIPVRLRPAWGTWRWPDPLGGPVRPHVRIFTDASFDPVSKSASVGWVMCTDWLVENLRLFVHSAPRNSMLALLREQRVAGGCRLDGRFDSSTQAELTGIFLALLTVPLEVSIIVETDSCTSIAAIRGFPAVVLDRLSLRNHVRSPHRAILRAIHAVILEKLDYGSVVDFSHTRSHTSSGNLHACGNRAADAWAAHMREASGAVFRWDWRVFDLPIQMDIEPDGPVANGALRHVIGDPRAAIRRRMLTFHQKRWLASASQSAVVRQSPSLFPCRWFLENHHGGVDLSFIMMVATRTLPLGMVAIDMMSKTPAGRDAVWAADADMSRWACPLCRDAEDSLDHLLVCRVGARRVWRAVDGAALEESASASSGLAAEVENDDVPWVRPAALKLMRPVRARILAWWERAISAEERCGLFSFETVRDRLATMGVSVMSEARDLALGCLAFASSCWALRGSRRWLWSELRFRPEVCDSERGCLRSPLP